ncbi:MAG: oligosaccharide flippase family protein [Gemmatimonadaceae bacterium]
MIPAVGELWGRLNTAFLRTDKTRTLLRGSLSVFALRCVTQALRLLLVVLLAHALGANGYGIYAYALTWLALLQVLGLVGLDQVLVRFVSAYREMRSWALLRGVIRFSSALGIANAVGIALIFILFVQILPAPSAADESTMLITAALLPIVVGALLRQSVLRGLDHPALAQLPENILYQGFLILLLIGARFAGSSGALAPRWAAVLNLVAWLLAFAVGMEIVRRKLPLEMNGVAPSYLERHAWSSAMPGLLFSGSAYYVFSRVDVLILGTLGSATEVGIYTVASRGAELMSFVYEAMMLAGTSLFSGIFAGGDRVELQRFTDLVTKSILWFSLPVYPVLFLLTPWFLSLFGSEFTAGVGVMRFLLTTFFLSVLGGFVLQMLYVTGNERKAAVVTGGAALLNIALSLLLVPRLGMMGAALASGTSLLVMKGSLVWVLYRQVGILSLPFRFTLNNTGRGRQP